jgi:hypothetical protein
MARLRTREGVVNFKNASRNFLNICAYLSRTLAHYKVASACEIPKMAWLGLLALWDER